MVQVDQGVNMSLILSDSNNISCLIRANLDTKSGIIGDIVRVGGYEIKSADFCSLIEYFLLNTDLDKFDVRRSLVDTIKQYRIGEGFNKGNIRFHPPGEPPQRSTESQVDLETDYDSEFKGLISELNDLRTAINHDVEVILSKKEYFDALRRRILTSMFTSKD